MLLRASALGALDPLAAKMASLLGSKFLKGLDKRFTWCAAMLTGSSGVVTWGNAKAGSRRNSRFDRTMIESSMMADVSVSPLAGRHFLAASVTGRKSSHRSYIERPLDYAEMEHGDVCANEQSRRQKRLG